MGYLSTEYLEFAVALAPVKKFGLFSYKSDRHLLQSMLCGQSLNAED